MERQSLRVIAVRSINDTNFNDIISRAINPLEVRIGEQPVPIMAFPVVTFCIRRQRHHLTELIRGNPDSLRLCGLSIRNTRLIGGGPPGLVLHPGADCCIWKLDTDQRIESHIESKSDARNEFI
jgi:hypothetical protein